MTFSDFIAANLDAIIEEWERFARESIPVAETMTDLALRDHSREILLAVTRDMAAPQTRAERTAKSKGSAEQSASQTAATVHGRLRQASGFNLVQLVSEFRAMRESVLALWRATEGTSDREAAIEEITRFNEGIDQAVAESVARYEAEVIRSRDTFLGVLGHDLRGPLATVEMSGRILATLDLPSPGPQTVGRIRRASKTMGHLVSDLLEYTRSQLGQGIRVQRVPCDLRQICAEAVDATRAVYSACEFVSDLQGDLIIEGDGPRLQRVLTNLLNNAIEHGERGTPVAIGGHGQPDAVVLDVANAGPAIPSDALESIFEPMVQLPRPTAEQQPENVRTNLGLGLFIVRQIVQAHGGDISVRSDATSGTVFTIRLPRRAPAT